MVFAAPAAAEPPAELERIVITATRTERSQLDVPASVDLITGDEVRDGQWRVNLSESLARIPGLVILNRQNYAQDLQISVRGFGARSTFGVRGVRMYVDGIPATMPDGQGQVAHFPLTATDRIEILRGPFSALYGNSSGGVIALTTRLPTASEAEFAVAAGAHGSWRVGAGVGGGSDDAGFAAEASRFSTDGYRAHSAATRDLASVRGGLLRTPLGALRLSFNAIDMPALDPLGLTRDQWQADPRQAAPQALQFNTRKTTRQSQLGAELTSAVAAWKTTATAWLGTRDVVQFQSIPVAVQAPRAHPGGVIDFDRTFGGLDFRVQRTLGRAVLTAGVAVERLNEDRRGYENFVGAALGLRGALRRDERNVVESRDAYLQVEAPIGERWRALAGVRGSRVSFDGRDRFLANGDDSGAASYSAFTPTVGVVFRPGALASLYASYGRGFETPTLNELAYRPDGSAGYNAGLQAARSHNVELGAKVQSAGGARATVAVFAIETDDDIVVRTNVGGRSSFANAASTRRRGVEVSAGQRLGRWSLTASAAALRATFAQPFAICGGAPCSVPTVTIAAGNRLPGVPAYTAAIEAVYRAPLVDVSLEWRAQGRLPVDDRNTDAAPGYSVVNLSLVRPLGFGGPQSRAFLRIDNLLGARYIGSVIVNEGNGRFFEPAPGRSWLIGADLRF